AVQTTTLLALRALGVLDARARGLVAQYALP
ncbi:MAG: TetR/AcrR family transcriptional regulator, partial [Pseudolabrys sp.]